MTQPAGDTTPLILSTWADAEVTHNPPPAPDTEE